MWLRVSVFTLMMTAFSSQASSWVIDKEDELDLKKEVVKKVDAVGGDVEAELAKDELRYRSAVKEYVREVKKYWSRAEVTDATTWVVYSDDWSIKRVVDFEANEIRLTLPRLEIQGRIDFAKTNKAVKAELMEVLLTDMKSAYDRDPISSTIKSDFKDDEEYLASLNDVLVFSELFSSSDPSTQEVNRLATKLMQSALITYQQNLAALSVDNSKSDFGKKTVSSVSIPVKLNKRLTYTVPLPKDRLRRKAKELKPVVVQYAKQHDVPPDLLFAIIHTESHFNPLARSPVPAYGLMQIVPSTAGRDASKALFDRSRRFSPSYLYNPKNNIELGAAYLNLVYYRYLGDIENPRSRLYCAIAAYNTGAANVAKAFITQAKMNVAIPKINLMSDEEVLDRLFEKLTSRETRGYLKKVLSRRVLYKRV